MTRPAPSRSITAMLTHSLDAAVVSTAAPPDAEPVIGVRGLRKGYGTARSSRGIDLDVRRGEIVAVLGPNGAGKTTTV